MTQQEALDILKTGKNVFLTGEPGSGKTHTVNRYVQYLHERGVKPAITASTGIAATHIGGMTIHSWSGIGVRKSLDARDLMRLGKNRRVAKRVRAAPILIIDEISMLAAETLAVVEVACRALREDRRPFGGLQVVLVGDFFQLPPIAAREQQPAQEALAFAPRAAPAQFACASPAWHSLHITVCYLSEQYRQEDAAYLEVLAAIRRGAVTASHLAALKARRAPAPQKRMTQLFSHNADVDRMNHGELAKLPGRAHAFAMESRGPDVLVGQLKKGCISPEILSLKAGARVMFTKNNFEEGYVNGTIGAVEGFAEESDCPIVKTRAGNTIFVQPAEWTIEDGGRVLARIIQMPLRLAWALTVHKSQGMSLDEAHMDLTDAFEYGQGYVALSRIRTLAGLSLAGFNNRALEIHPDIRAKDAEFRDASRAAHETFAKISSQELTNMHRAFLGACGGKVAGAAQAATQASSMAAIREEHPNAYHAWSNEEDADLARRHAAGERVGAIAISLGRKHGAIRSRLTKLGLA